MFMNACISASMFLEIWKRNESVLRYDWDVAGFKQEEVFRCCVHSYIQHLHMLACVHMHACQHAFMHTHTCTYTQTCGPAHLVQGLHVHVGCMWNACAGVTG